MNTMLDELKAVNAKLELIQELSIEGMPLAQQGQLLYTNEKLIARRNYLEKQIRKNGKKKRKSVQLLFLSSCLLSFIFTFYFFNF